MAMIYRNLKKSDTLRILIDGVGFCTSVGHMQKGGCDSFIHNAFSDFCEDYVMNGTIGRMSQYPDWQGKNRNVQIDLIS